MDGRTDEQLSANPRRGGKPRGENENELTPELPAAATDWRPASLLVNHLASYRTIQQQRPESMVAPVEDVQSATLRVAVAGTAGTVMACLLS